MLKTGNRAMIDVQDVRRIALSLADVTGDEAGTTYHVGKTGIAWPYRERVHPKRARVPRLDIFVIRVADEDDKQALLEGEPHVFFATPHYDGYPAIMVRLAEIDEARLTELLMDARAAAIAKTATPRSRKPARRS